MMSAASSIAGRHAPAVRMLIAGLIAVLSVCGCGTAVPASGTPAASAIDRKPAANGQPPAAPAPPATRSVDGRDNGSTVVLRRGQHLVLSLGDNAVGGTYWHLAPPHPGGVVRGGPVSVHSRNHPGQIAGSGVGTVVQEFTAEADGTTNISAHRTSCGEALRCSLQQATFTITIDVAD
jgi:predicted secreted protein